MDGWGCGWGFLVYSLSPFRGFEVVVVGGGWGWGGGSDVPFISCFRLFADFFLSNLCSRKLFKLFCPTIGGGGGGAYFFMCQHYL